MAKKPKSSSQALKAFVEMVKRTLGLQEDDPVMQKLRAAKTEGEARKIAESARSEEGGKGRASAPSRAAAIDRATSERSGGWGSAQAAAAARAGRFTPGRTYTGGGPTAGPRGPSSAVSTAPVVANPASPVDPRQPRPRPTESYTPFTPAPSTPNSYIPGGRVHYTTGGGSAAGKASVPQKAYDAYKSAKSAGQPYTGPTTPSTNQPYSPFHSAPYRLTNQTGQGFTSESYSNQTRPTPVPTQRISVPPQQGYRSDVAYGRDAGMNRPPDVALRSVPTQSFSPVNASGQQTHYNPLNPQSANTGTTDPKTPWYTRSTNEALSPRYTDYEAQRGKALGGLQQAQQKYQSAIKDTDYGYGRGGYGTRDFSGSGYGDVGTLSSRIMSDLQRDYNITREQAAGAVGNLAHESDGFKAYNQYGGGGVGWAQWSKSRRTDFENFTKENNLDPRSYEANYKFMKHELDTSHAGTIPALRKANTVEEATLAWEKNYEKAGKPQLGKRLDYANSIYGGYSPSSASNFDNNIAKIQEQLNAKGASLAVDGIMGPKTRAAMTRFAPSGVPGGAPVSQAVPTTGPATGILGRVKSGISNVAGRVANAAGQAVSYASYGGPSGGGGGGGSRGSVGSYSGGGGGGSRYSGGTYGGSGGSRISEGVGGAYRNR